MSDAAKPLPTPDRDSERFWQGVAAGELRLQHCDDCGAWRWPAPEICGRCHTFDSNWAAVSGTGRIVSWVTTHQVFSPAYRDAVPYDVVQVALDEQDDIQMIGNLVGGAKPAPGLRVRALCVEADEDATLVHWEPIRGASGC